MTILECLKGLLSLFGIAESISGLWRDARMRQAGADAVTANTEAEIARIADEQAQNSALPRTARDVADRLRHDANGGN